MLKTIIFILAALVIVFSSGCKKDSVSTPTTVSITGAWDGTTNYSVAANFELILNLVDINGTVTGTGTLKTVIATKSTDVPLVVTGTVSGFQVNLKFNTLDSFKYTGTVTSDGKSMTGTLDYTGYTGIPMNLKKS